MSGSNRPIVITSIDVQEELMCSMLERIIDSSPDMRGVGLLLCRLLAFAYVNVQPSDRAVWLAALSAFVEGMPEAAAQDERLTSQPLTRH